RRPGLASRSDPLPHHRRQPLLLARRRTGPVGGRVQRGHPPRPVHGIPSASRPGGLTSHASPGPPVTHPRATASLLTPAGPAAPASSKPAHHPPRRDHGGEAWAAAPPGPA